MGFFAQFVNSLNLTAVSEHQWVALTAIGALVLPFITLGGFWLVIKQLKGEREALETQTREQVYTASLGILQMFVQHPDVRPYFYDAIALPTQEPERSKVLAACEIMGDHWENILLSEKALDTETLHVWRDYMAGIYSTSPSLRHFLLHEGYRYSGGFLTLFDAELPSISKRQRAINLGQAAEATAG